MEMLLHYTCLQIQCSACVGAPPLWLLVVSMQVIMRKWRSTIYAEVIVYRRPRGVLQRFCASRIMYAPV